MTIEIKDVVGFATLQDLGRIGVAQIAVSRSGAFDLHSHELANRLVGNSSGAATIESLRARLSIKLIHSGFLAVTGAPVSIRINGRELEMFRALHVQGGDELEITPTNIGMRTYLAFRGGIQAKQVMGSVSFDQLGQIGTPPLSPGDIFHIGASPSSEIELHRSPNPGITVGSELQLQAEPAPRWNRFEDAENLYRKSFELSNEINRVGLRLTGHAFKWDTNSRLASEGLVLGAVQVPVDGVPLIFGPDHPTTAGYPVIAVVTRDSLNMLAQAEPGTKIRFYRS